MIMSHRQLRFESVADCRQEIERILQAHQYGTLRTTGNWTPGQNLSHIAAWIEYAYEGFPVPRPPFFVRWMMRWILPRILRGKMPKNVRIPRVPGGTTGMDDVTIQDAARRLQAALTRLESDEPAPFDSPAFGKMSHADRIRLNLRHAELHLGYLNYDAPN